MGVATEQLNPPRQGGRTRKALSSIRREFGDPEKRTAYWMILPTVLIIALVAAWPILYAVFLSFQRILPNITEWAGIDNYVTMFGDSTF